jgi:hypothetical protein
LITVLELEEDWQAEIASASKMVPMDESDQRIKTFVKPLAIFIRWDSE